MFNFSDNKRGLRLNWLIMKPTVFIFLLILIVSGCNNIELPGSWASNPIKIDGNIQDWNDLPTSYFEEQDMMTAISNDSSFLYIHFRTRDFMTASLIRRTGLKIYIDKSGKNKKDFFVKLNEGPKKPIATQSMGDAGNSKKGAKFGREFPQNGRDSRPRLTCCIKDRIVEKIIPFDGSEGPSAAYDTSYGFYSYEIAVPLDWGSTMHFGLDVELGQKISIGAEWGDMGDMKNSMKSHGDSGMKGGGGRSGGGKGGRAGRSGGGRGTGGGPSRSDLPGKQEIWANVLLAEPQ